MFVSKNKRFSWKITDRLGNLSSSFYPETFENCLNCFFSYIDRNLFTFLKISKTLFRTISSVSIATKFNIGAVAIRSEPHGRQTVFASVWRFCHFFFGFLFEKQTKLGNAAKTENFSVAKKSLECFYIFTLGDANDLQLRYVVIPLHRLQTQ